MLSVVWLKRLIHFGAVIGFLLPFGLGAAGMLGPDPANELIDISGQLAIYLFAITLLAPLLKKLFSKALAFRKILGVYAFVFATQHLIWVYLYELGLDFGLLVSLTVEKPFVWLGMAAWLLLVPVALTSFSKIQKKIGKRWKQIHQVVYLAGLAAGLHYFLQLRGEFVTSLLVVALLALMLGYKAWRVLGTRHAKAKPKITSAV